jgi:hypothetical protein
VIARCVRWLGFPFLVAAFPHHTTRRPRGGERRRLVRSVPSVPREPEPERMSWWWWQGRGGILLRSACVLQTVCNVNAGFGWIGD